MDELTIGPGAERPGLRLVRRVHVHDDAAPRAAVVIPSVFVAVRDDRGWLLLVRRRDSGAWELPGGRVDVGESAVDAAVRETTEESGLRVRITGLVGLFSDPAHVIESAGGDEVRQQFVICFHARPQWGRPAPDLVETIDVAWFNPADLGSLPIEPGALTWIDHALSGALDPHFD